MDEIIGREMILLATVDVSTVLAEGLTEVTLEKKKLVETMLEGMFEKYGVEAGEGDKLVAAVRDYAEGIYGDVYDMAVQAGAGLGDMRGYRKAMEEAEDVAAEMIATALMKR